MGISIFVRPTAPAFECVVKRRYTDFQVNEILLDGRVVRLEKDSLNQDRKRKRAGVGNGEDVQKKPRVEGEAVNGDEEDVKPGNTSTDVVAPNGSNAEGDAATRAQEVKTAKADAIASIKDEDKGALVNIFGESVTASILDLYASTMAYPNRKPRDHPTILSEPLAEKSKRTEAHIAIRRIFGANKLESITVQDQKQQSGPGTVIQVKATAARGAANEPASRTEPQKGKVAWFDLGGEYMHCTLYKENKDTMEVMYFLASQLKLNIKHFSFAGTKDRRGVTVQRIAVHRVKRERLEGLNRMARGFRLAGPWEYKPEGLDLGMLAGNEFALTLRDAHFGGEQAGLSIEERVRNATAVVQDAAKNLGEHGFLNYYGLQRFGTHTIGTHVIGMKILKGDLKGAVDDVLSYDPALAAVDLDQEQGSNGEGGQKYIPRDDINRAKAIRAFRSGAKTSEALDFLPGSRFAGEKGIMTFLGKRDHKTGAKPNETDFQGALLQVQRNLRLMYVHAYQSFVWNTVVGRRWELFGNKVVEGDLVVVGEKERQEGLASGGARKDEVDESGEPIVKPSASAAVGTQEHADAGPADEYTDDPFVRARPLSKEEAESGRFTILDVVLPLPGYDVEYPSNAIGDFYKEFMASDAGGGLDPHNMRRAWKETSLSGGYRKMMARPLGQYVQVEVKPYQGAEVQLLDTELEKMQKADGTAKATEPASTEEGEQRLAIILRLRLGSSQYATMAVRELTKGGATAYKPEYSVTNR